MVEAKNFVEKELGKNLEKETTENIPEEKEPVPIYIQPQPQEQQIQQPPIVQIIEKIVYKKQRIHGFFRTLTIIALLTIGFLMLGESTGIISLSINNFKVHQIFPIIIILSSIIIWSYRGLFGKLFGLIMFLAIRGGIFTISIYTSLNPSSTRKEGHLLDYELPSSNNLPINIYLQTLIGNSYIKGTNKQTIGGMWNSDRHLQITGGETQTTAYITFTENNNRNMLQKHNSNLDLELPQDIKIKMLYLKNFLGLHTIDLTKIQRQTLKIHGGINDITIKVNNVFSGNKIEIQGAAANIDIQIPKNIGVIVYHKHYGGNLNLVGFKKNEKSPHYFESQNITTTKTILHIYINMGLSNTKIHRTK